MAATILDSEEAVEASRLIVDVFVEVRHRLNSDSENPLAPLADQHGALTPLGTLAFGRGSIARLQRALDHVLDSVIDADRQKTVREEARHVIAESIQSLKDRLKRQGLENAEIEARVVKYLAEAETEKAVAAKTRAEADKLEFAVIISKLRLLLEAQRAMEQDQMDGFLEVLRDMDR